jgi:hypothetical protein|tara:strand:+ start:4055 stop:4906 length:852 start_codon:yes stop_codon:yes gene_type:complete
MDYLMPNKEISIQPSTIETIDLSMYDLIDNKFDLYTKTNTGFKKVPVLWISPERAVDVKNKEIRDSVGKLKLPLITIERTSFSKDPTFKGGYQANLFPETSGPRGYRKHQRKIAKSIAQKATRKFASSDAKQDKGQYHYPTDNKKVVYEEIYTPIPVWVSIMYSVTLRTEYQQQMNDLVTPFATRTGNINCLVISNEQHRYEAFIQQDMSYTNNVSNLGEEERSFMTKIDIKVLGYLLGDGINEEVPKIIMKETVVEVKLIRERTIIGDEKPWETDDKKYRDI